MSKTVCRSEKIGAITFVALKEAGNTIAAASINGNKIKIDDDNFIGIRTKKLNEFERRRVL